MCLLAVRFPSDDGGISASWTDPDGEDRKFEATLNLPLGTWDVDKADLALDHISQDDIDGGDFHISESSCKHEVGSFMSKFVRDGDEEKSFVITGSRVGLSFDEENLVGQGVFDD